MNFNKVSTYVKTAQKVWGYSKSTRKLVPTQVPKIYEVEKRRIIKVFLYRTVKMINMMSEMLDVDESSKMLPPNNVRGMKFLDKSKFVKSVFVPTLEVPNKNMSFLMKSLDFKKILLKVPGISQISNLSSDNLRNDTHKLILLDPDTFENVDEIEQFIKEKLLKAEVDLTSFKMMEIDLKYENWNYYSILNSVLPKDCNGVGGFTNVGHIVHLNLREELNEYKSIIGEVILDKITNIKTVVNKTSNIDNTYRNFQMEVIAGESDFITVVKEHGIQFKMDYSKVYWNTRLGTEHRRLVEKFTKGDIVFDMFAGIGPFAIPAAKKGCQVFANDLNPHSYFWLNENYKLNKVKASMETFYLDGRDFAKEVIKKEMESFLESDKLSESQIRVHIIMNLPALAVEFTDIFPGLISERFISHKENLSQISVYCYSFSKEENAKESLKQVLGENLGCDIPADCDVRFVRNVAPSKDMYCITFTLPWEMLCGSSGDGEKNKLETLESQNSSLETSDFEPESKKIKL